MERARRILVAGLCAIVWCAALAQGVTTPVLRGVMGKGEQAVTLWELPGKSGTAPVGIGAGVPDTRWKVAGVKALTGEVWVYVDRKTPVLFWQGSTYLSGTKATSASGVVPENHPTRESRPSAPLEVTEAVAEANRRSPPASAVSEARNALLKLGETFTRGSMPVQILNAFNQSHPASTKVAAAIEYIESRGGNAAKVRSELTSLTSSFGKLEALLGSPDGTNQAKLRPLLEQVASATGRLLGTLTNRRE